MTRQARRTPLIRRRGQYEIFEILGRGNFAIVYLAKHIQLGTRVAIKELHVPLEREQEEQFFHEAYISARLVHPHIVRVLDYDVEDGVPFLVMDYAPYGTLRHLHPHGTRLPLRTVVSYVKHLADALQYAHQRFVVHCDLKPENILVGRNGRILLSDFGIAKIAGAHEQDKIVGTLPYMAPEQIDGTPCTESDQYAVAIIVYEFLSGKCPFQGSREAIIYQHRKVTPASLREQLPALPIAVEQVIMKALSKRPADRYPSVSAFAAALEQASRIRRQPPMEQGSFNAGGAAGGTPPAAPGGNWWQLWRPFLMLLFAVLLVLGAGTAAEGLLPQVNITLKQTDLTRPGGYNLSANIHPGSGQVQARFVNVTTASQSQKVTATGTQTIGAASAIGIITFSNEGTGTHFVPAGTRFLVPNTRLQVETDRDVTIPAANSVTPGKAETPAHVVQAGTIGNSIAANNLRQHCCSNDQSILVDNPEPFSGGQDPQQYTVVRQRDIDGAAKSLQSLLMLTVPSLLQAKASSNEALVDAATHCNPKVSKDATVGDRAAQVTVTVVLICVGEVYDKLKASEVTKQQYILDIGQALGSDYKLVSSTLPAIAEKVGDRNQGVILLHITIAGTWRFNPNDVQKQMLLQSIAGERKEEAIAQLSKLPGVQAVIQPTWCNLLPGDMLPTNLNQMTLVVVHAGR